MRVVLKDTPIIFLDIDGVLNHSGIKNESDFVQESIDVLNMVYDKIPYNIVLSTSWKETFVFSDLVEFLHGKGVLAPIIDKTPFYIGEYGDGDIDLLLGESYFNTAIGEYQGRNKEIIDYVRIHDIKTYCILDDFEMTNKELKPHQILTDWFDKETGGLRYKHYDGIIDILSK